MTEFHIQKGPLTEATAETVADFVFEDRPRPVGLGGTGIGKALSEILERESFRGGEGKLFLWHPRDPSPARKILIAGLGSRKGFRLEVLRRACAAIARRLRGSPTPRLALPATRSLVGGTDFGEVVRAEVEGLLLGDYRFSKYRTDSHQKLHRLQKVEIVAEAGQGKKLESAVRLSQVSAAATNFARDLVSEPAGYLTPSRMVSIAKRLAKERGITCEVMGPPQLKRLRMGGLLGVAQGSSEPPYLILLKYRPARRARKRIALVGKGLTFDSGGLSLKNAESMETMKCDMAGAASVLAVMGALPALKPPVEVIGLLAMAENMPGGGAIRPGDVLRMHSGLTVEVRNTDAEGRLVLADALSFAGEQSVDEVIDLATLTGSCVVALGPLSAGVMGNDQKFIDRILEAGDRSGEMMWQLPLYEEYREQLRSDVADIRNTGNRWGGAITAGLFLSRFVKPDLSWAHLDIAGPAFLEEDSYPIPKGATGAGVRTLLRLLCPGGR